MGNLIKKILKKYALALLVLFFVFPAITALSNAGSIQKYFLYASAILALAYLIHRSAKNRKTITVPASPDIGKRNKCAQASYKIGIWMTAGAIFFAAGRSVIFPLLESILSLFNNPGFISSVVLAIFVSVPFIISYLIFLILSILIWTTPIVTLVGLTLGIIGLQSTQRKAAQAGLSLIAIGMIFWVAIFLNPQYFYYSFPNN